MLVNVNNGAVNVSSSKHTPRCLDINTHFCGRTVKTSATHWPERDKDHKDGKRTAYISVRIHAAEEEWEVPEGEISQNATEQTIFLDIEHARALRDAITAALERP